MSSVALSSLSALLYYFYDITMSKCKNIAGLMAGKQPIGSKDNRYDSLKGTLSCGDQNDICFVMQIQAFPDLF